MLHFVMSGGTKMERWLASGLCLAVLVGFSSPAPAEETITIGNSNIVVRTVTGKLGTEGRKLSLYDDVYHNELIETAKESATEIEFLDQTKLALGPNSSLVLDSVVFDPDPAKSSFITTTTKGVFRFVTGNLPKKSYTIHTPNATIGIRGTVFSLSVLPSVQADGSVSTVVKFNLEEGAADIIGCQGKRITLDRGGKSATLTKGQSGHCSQSVRDF
jgi:hypothetical protein